MRFQLPQMALHIQAFEGAEEGLGAQQGGLYDSNPNVEKLSSSSFPSGNGEGFVWLIEYYAPWSAFPCYLSLTSASSRYSLNPHLPQSIHNAQQAGAWLADFKAFLLV